MDNEDRIIINAEFDFYLEPGTTFAGQIRDLVQHVYAMLQTGYVDSIPQIQEWLENSGRTFNLCSRSDARDCIIATSQSVAGDFYRKPETMKLPDLHFADTSESLVLMATSLDFNPRHLAAFMHQVLKKFDHQIILSFEWGVQTRCPDSDIPSIGGGAAVFDSESFELFTTNEWLLSKVC